MKSLSLILLMLTAVIAGFSQVKKVETVQLEDNTIYYEVYGEGEPLFLFHGYTHSSKYWLPYLFNYTDHYEVYLVDLPGHGRSGPLPKDMSLSKITRPIEQLISYLGFEKIRAIGFSFGGDVVFKLASLDPDLIESAIMIGTHPNRSVQKDLAHMIEYLSYANLHNLSWVPAYQTDTIQMKNMLDLFPKYNSMIPDEDIKAINSRILMVYGDNDLGINLEEIARVRSILPHSDLLFFPNSGHSAHQGDNFEYFASVSLKHFKNKLKQ